MKARIAAMSPEEQMKLAMQIRRRHSQSALKDVKAMAADPEAVQNAADHYADYQVKHMSSTAASRPSTRAVSDIRQRVSARELEISGKTVTALEVQRRRRGSCPRPIRLRTRRRCAPRSTRSSPSTTRRCRPSPSRWKPRAESRAPDIAAAQRDLGPAQYGSAAQSNNNRQLLAAYHNAVLMEIEQLLVLSEDTAKWAAARFKDRSINFNKID